VGQRAAETAFWEVVKRKVPPNAHRVMLISSESLAGFSTT
jgi:hypothetical protein